MTAPSFATLLESYFVKRLIGQRQASPNTIKAYRDTFHLMLEFIQRDLGKKPSDLSLTDVDATTVVAFLDHLESSRSVKAQTRNSRLAAIRSFFKYVSIEAPVQSALIQRVLAIPSKRQSKPLVSFMNQLEVTALLAAPDRKTWSGCRDHAFLLIAVQTGLRVSEMTGLTRQDLILDSGAHIRVVGKGRKERCTPLLKQTVRVLNAWMNWPRSTASDVLFPNARGGRLSADGVQYMLNKHVRSAQQSCPSLQKKRITPHVLRHTTAMEMLQAGVDTALIALWLGHETVATTQMYLHADMALKRAILEKTSLPGAAKSGIYQPGDRLLSFLRNL